MYIYNIIHAEVKRNGFFFQLIVQRSNTLDRIQAY